MNAPTDLAALENRQRIAGATGDRAILDTGLQTVGESLAEAVATRR